MSYTITKIRRGSKSKGRGHLLYAQLRDGNNDLAISATLKYVIEVATARDFDVSNMEQAIETYNEFQLTLPSYQQQHLNV